VSTIRVGAGPGDPDLLVARALEVLGEAAVVVAPPALAGLARSLCAPGTPVLTPARAGEAARMAGGATVVHLVPGDGLTTPDDGGHWPAPDDLVPGPPVDADRRARAVLADQAAARPLQGLSIVVTRAAGQAGELSRPLRRRGARVVEVPTIRIDPPADEGRALAAALDHVDRYDWLVLTSVNGARAVLDRLPDGRRLAGVRLAAIGPATAAALAAAHLPADLVPPRFVAESLLEVFPVGAGRVLLARAAVARDVLPTGLAAAGWQVDVVEAYRTATPDPPLELLDDVGRADVACFTSPSTFERFCEVVGAHRLPPHLACIGPVTAGALRRAGFEPAVEAGVHTMIGLVEAITAWARSSKGTEPARPAT
jgi:uroporphyrinogen-III synthase